MPDYEHLSRTRIVAVFKDAVTALDGEVTDAVDDGQRLFARSVLPKIKALRADDRFQAGVALRAEEHGLWLHPYLFRLVCGNGAVMARALASRHLETLDVSSADEAEFALHQAVKSCCAEDVFTEALQGMRRAQATAVGSSVALMRFLMHFSSQRRHLAPSQIRKRFSQGGDSSTFGLINAITSVARDTPDPELRWELEKHAGEMIMGATHELRPDVAKPASPRRERGLDLVPDTTTVHPEQTCLFTNQRP